jgi:hypothetical protein
MDARELIAAARRRKVAGDLAEAERLLRSAIFRGKNDSSAMFTAQYFLGQLLLQAQANKVEGMHVLQQAWQQGIDMLQGSAAGTTAARAILHGLCCVLLLHLDMAQSTEVAAAVRQQYAVHLSTAGNDAASAYACATCKSSITEVSGSVEDDALWYCSPCIAAYAAEMLSAGYSCATCGANSTNTDGSVESDNLWYCKACIAAYELEVQSTTAATENAADNAAADNTIAEVSACCNCSDSTVPLIQTSSQSKLYCEACLQELAESGDTVLRYTAEELRLQQCSSALSTAALPDSVAAMYARHSIVAVDSKQQQQQQRGPKQHKQKQQQQQQSKPGAAQPADLPLHQRQDQQQQQQQQQQQYAQAQSLASNAAVAAAACTANQSGDAVNHTDSDDPLL